MLNIPRCYGELNMCHIIFSLCFSLWQLPAIEAVLEASPMNERIVNDIISLIICPTRELALQISMQARTLLQFHTDIKLKVLTGGFRISKEREALQASLCQVCK